MRFGTALKLFLSIAVTAGATTAPLAAAAPPRCSDGTLVRTDTGPICGVAGDGITNWLGVPYAAPPLGDLRWRSPRRHPGWTTPLAATTPGPPCAQLPLVRPGSTEEDCLKLNVRVPEHAGRGPLAVMVLFHGGGFRVGAPYDGTHLATSGRIIHVEVAYRLGIMGFLSHETFGAHAGNYGLRDQQAALGWVQRNIANFGGDPGNVTIFGQSAGGSSVCAAMASPTARGLFHKGIAESGEYNSVRGVNTMWVPQDCAARLPSQADAQAAGDRFAKTVGCTADVANCLRATPVQDLLDAAGDGTGPDNGTIGPIVDGRTLPRSPGEAFATGRFNPVPLIHGVARDETQIRPAETPAEYEDLIRKQYGPHAAEVMKRYPLSRFPDPAPYIASRTVLADANSVCPALLNDRRMARHTQVYAYRFDDTNPPPLGFVDSTKPAGAFHVGELGYLYPGNVELDANQRAFRAQLTAQWTGFARTGTPTVDGTPSWPPFADDGQMSLMPAGDSRMITETARQHNCDFWHRFAPFPG